MYRMARERTFDPIAFRRRNLIREGRLHATGQVVDDAPLERVMDEVLERMRCSAPFDKGPGTVRRGRGIAIAIKAVTSPTTSVAIVNISADGSVTLYCGSVGMGKGPDTPMGHKVC